MEREGVELHTASEVHPQAELAPGVKVGPWCRIGPQVKIGENTELQSHVVIEGDTTIGKNNVFYPFSVIGVKPQDLKYQGEPTQLVIGDRNTFRESVSVHAGTEKGGGVTRIENDNLLMGYVHIGHDVVIKNNVVLANYVGVAGHCVIEDSVIIGGQSGIVQFLHVGSHAYIGGQSAIERDIPPYVIATGARPLSVKGANIVGLRRRGFSTEIIQKINEAIKLWIRPEVEKEQCLLEIESQYGDIEEIQNFLQFIKSSENGIAK